MNTFKIISGLIILIILTAPVIFSQQKFIHTVTSANRYCNSTCSLIDIPELNNNPLAIISVSPILVNGVNPSPQQSGTYDVDSKKWSIINADKSAIPVGAKFIVEYCTRADIKPLDPSCNCPAALPPNGNAGGDLTATYPNPSVQKLLGRPLSTNVPKIGQILKWNGTEWIPVEDNVSSAAVPPIAPKLSFLTFNQTITVGLDNLNINTTSIAGLDNRSFTLEQNSRVVFRTVIDVMILGVIQANPTGIKLFVEILNPANAVVARATALGWLAKDTPQTLVSAGTGILPKGTYHTKVSIIRQAGGAELYAVKSGLLNPFNNQGGQMMIQIFPN
jgi:hypothetical protein